MRKILTTVLLIGLMLIAGIRFATPTNQIKARGEVIAKAWSVEDSKAYAQDKIYEWHNKEWSCLNKLWNAESHWRPNAYNKIKVMGKNAGGIPQLLGLDPKTPATIQIDRGLSYIYNRYSTPCEAWKFYTKKGYY